MLTHPCDSLPQIVCPMDGDAIPPNPFCSAPPQSEPPPPLLPLSSITPSLANDGIPRHTRSGRIQGVTSQTLKKQNTDSGAAQKPIRQNPSSTKRQRKDRSMVQVSQSKQLRVESTHVHGKQNEDGFDFSYTAECQIKQNDQESPPKKTNVSPTENVDEQFAYDTTHDHTDAIMSDMVTCRGLDTLLENTSAPKGWVIGPLFQSFKSKMASFTEIVMSPVKLFRANSPPLSVDHPEKVSECERPADGPSDVEHSEPSNTLHPDGQSENRDSEAETTQQRLSDVEDGQTTKTVDIKCCKKVLFDKESADSSEKANEGAVTQKETNCRDSVPSQHSSLPCFVSEHVLESVESAVGFSMLSHSSVNFSGSHESKLEIFSDVQDQKDKQDAMLKPLPRKRLGNKSESKKITSKSLISELRMEESDTEANYSSDNNKTVPLLSLNCYTQPDTDCLQLDGDENGAKIESCRLIRQSLRNHLNNSAGRTLKPNTDIQQLEDSVACLGRAKRGLRQRCPTQDLVKRKKLTGDKRTGDTQKQELLNVASDSGIMRGLPREEVVLTSTIVDTEETLRSARKKTVSTRTNKKGKGGQEMLPIVNEAMTKTESSPEAMLVCSLDKSSDVSVNNQKVCSSKMKPSASCKSVRLSKPDVITDDSMDLETTVAISSTKQVEEGLLSEVFVRPDIKQLQSKSSIRNKKPLKRKSPIQESSLTESNSTLVSTSSVHSKDPSELMATDFNISLPVQREESLKTRLNQPSKRPKKGLRGAFKSASKSGGAQEEKQCINNINMITKESQYQEDKSKISMDPVYFEMTPSESSHQPTPSFSQLHPSSCVLLNNEVKHVVDEKEKSPDSVVDEVFLADNSVSRLRSSARRATSKPRRADSQRRKCRVLHSRTCKGEEVKNSVTMEDADLAATPTRPSENSFSRCLLRSYSCPEIPSFHSHDAPWTASLHSPQHSRTPTSHQHHSSHISHVPHSHKSVQRARRHTVCSVEVEREIAPLCLRKEVYPSRRSAPYDSVTQYLSPTLALSPSTTLSALASCFLSSPLAFLSKKFDSRSAAASPSKSSHVSFPTSSSLKSPTWHLPGFLKSDGSSHDTLDSSSSRNPLECEPERRQESEEEYGEDTSSSSQEYEDVGLREEKALSDSEIKVEQKHEERGKVSSIRIRKTLPKPQNNLTPMGLPKPIRLKKKQFSLEEIYTNKNFSKPPESRLETIFEVPLNRRNGSESWFGQRRVKRFLEFLEAGEVRKPKKPLVGVGKTGVSSSRTRRGGFAKDEPSLAVQDVDSLLCAKLDELNLWLIHDQNS